MTSSWLKFSFACLIFAQCVLSGAGAAALNKEEKVEDFVTLSNLASRSEEPKPSAHIVAPYLRDVSYPIYTVIKDWSISDPHSHLEGGMTYDDGKLTVPVAGKYYIYANFHFLSEGRVQIRVNDDFVSLITSAVTQDGEAANANGMGVFVLNAGDTVSLRINPWGAPEDGSVDFWMQYHSCYFGAYLI